jgi:ATP/ADP translocase
MLDIFSKKNWQMAKYGQDSKKISKIYEKYFILISLLLTIMSILISTLIYFLSKSTSESFPKIFQIINCSFFTAILFLVIIFLYIMNFKLINKSICQKPSQRATANNPLRQIPGLSFS